MHARFERLAADLLCFPVVVRRRHDPRFEFYWHHHREFELTLIVKSRGRRFVGDNIAEYDDGDLVLLGPHLPHTWCSAPELSDTRHLAVVVQFSEDFLGLVGLESVELRPLRVLLKRAHRGIRFHGRARQAVAERLSSIDRQPPLLRMADLLTILERLSRSTEGEELSSRTFLPQEDSEIEHPIDRVWKLIGERYLERIPLDQAARVLGMSPSAFSRFFRRSTGKTFTGYLNELRIGHACRLLVESERGIADVADASGFSNLSHFNRSFLRLRGLRPREFRREHRRYPAAAV